MQFCVVVPRGCAPMPSMLAPSHGLQLQVLGGGVHRLLPAFASATLELDRCIKRKCCYAKSTTSRVSKTSPHGVRVPGPDQEQTIRRRFQNSACWRVVGLFDFHTFDLHICHRLKDLLDSVQDLFHERCPLRRQTPGHSKERSGRLSTPSYSGWDPGNAQRQI